LCTWFETIAQIVSWSLRAGGHNIIARHLIPNNHLFGTSDAFRRIKVAHDRRLGLRKRRSRGSAGDHALVTLHVHVGLPAATRHPEPSTSTASRWTGRHGPRDLIGGITVPWTVLENREDN
jgi:hypothetical protein